MASILIVDDQMPMRSILRALLTQAGYKVVAEASHGQKAIELNKQLKPDVICLDITMPGIDGIETLKKLKDDHPDVLVIMITGHSNRTDIEAAIEAGASGYIVKPIHAGKTIQTVERVLANRLEG
ncbi:MAG: response regulator [Oceanospirillales bacterium]|nr:MAG: response regulator [Oceanospirillales bacterium]